MKNCKLCEQGDPAITVTCWKCQKKLHLHQCQLDLAQDGVVIIANCPYCKVINCWQKVGKKVTYSGAVIYQREPILDLRMKR